MDWERMEIRSKNVRQEEETCMDLKAVQAQQGSRIPMHASLNSMRDW